MRTRRGARGAALCAVVVSTVLGAAPAGAADELQGTESRVLSAACIPTQNTLCIDDVAGDKRWKVELDWSTIQGGGQGGHAWAVPTTSIGVARGGLFAFFSLDNPEMLVKVLNGCGVNSKYWFFSSAGTNVALEVRVTDTFTGAMKTYLNPDLTAALPVQDVVAFPCEAGTPPEITVTLDGGIPLVLEKVTAGTFLMGTPDTELSRDSNEGPVHQVTLSSDFYLGKYEVTQAQWLAVTGTAHSSSCGDHGTGPNLPVSCVSWNEVAGAGGFVEKLNQYLTVTVQPGAGKFGLPTEAQWEYAARAGTSTRFWFGDALACNESCVACPTADPYLFWCANAGSTLQAVGQKGPNPFSLFDVNGNVFEFTKDWYQVYSSSAQTDPQGPPSGSSKVARGGSAGYDLHQSRSGNRLSMSPTVRDYRHGFRIARAM